MKLILFAVATFILSGCASFYVEPPLSSNNAVIQIEIEDPFIFNGAFGVIVEAKLDGKRFHSYNYPDLKARVESGKHKIALDLNAYYYNRAKHHFTESYEVDFQPGKIYTVKFEVENKAIDNNKDNVQATYSILGAGVNIRKEVTLKDSALRSMVCQVPNCTVPIVL